MYASSEDQVPIIALCTPEGHGALALIRLSGDQLFTQALPWIKLSGSKSLKESLSHTLEYGYVQDPLSAEKIDQVLFLIMRGPKSFTGHDTLEISCHNNKFIIQKIISLACNYGARLARPGEFTRRAVLNKKIDLLQAEAIHELITAQAEDGAMRALAQVAGSLSHQVSLFQKELVLVIAFVEASFEFLDEEQRDLNFHVQINTRIQSFKEKIGDIKASFHEYEALQRGLRIAIIGPTNAGKSTLFNALIKKERSIVTPLPGTTRDSIEAPLYKNNITLHLVDTAGLRETTDEIEREGIGRSIDEALQADMLLVVCDSSRTFSQQFREQDRLFIQKHQDRAVIIYNKIDCSEPHESLQKEFTDFSFLKLSAQKKIGLYELELLLESKIKELQNSVKSPYQLTKRQYLLFDDCYQKVTQLLVRLENNESIELIVYELRELLQVLSQLSGKDSTEEIFDQVFGSFCIGK